MYKLLLAFCFMQLTLSVKAQQTDALFMESGITKLQHAKTYTLQVADLVPESLYSFKPSKEEMNFGDQLLHLAGNLGWLSSSYLSSGKNPVTKEDGKLTAKADIRQVLVKAYDYAITTLQHFDPSALADTVHFFAGPMTKLQIINLLNDHQTHHRGQMIVYLRLNGIKPPDYVGW